MKIDNQVKKFITIAILSILFLLLLKISLVKYIFTILFIAFIFFVILRPVVRNAESGCRSRKLLSVLTIFSLNVVLIIIIISFLPIVLKESIMLKNEIMQLESFYRDQIARLKLNDNLMINSILNNFNVHLNNFITNAMQSIFRTLLKIGDNLITYVLVLVITYYFLTEEEKISSSALKLFADKSQNKIKLIFHEINKTLIKYFTGQIILSFIVMVLTFVLLCITGVKLALLLAAINGALNIIPYFGPLAGIFPITIIAMLKSRITAFYVFIGLLAIQQIEGNIIAPKIIGDSVKIHPVIIIMLLIIGEKIGGIFGMIIIVPVAAIFRILFSVL